MTDTATKFSLDGDAPELSALDLVLCRNVAEALNQHYPGHLWAVEPPHGGVLSVRDLSLSGEYGFHIKIPDIYSASELAKIAMRMGGELLERYNVARSRINHEKMATLPVDFAGNHILLK